MALKKQETIVFDLDGTAIDSPQSQHPSPWLIRAIRNAEPIFNLCAATGRVWSFAKPVLRELGLQDPCIISAGTQICDPKTGAIMWQLDIDDDPLRAVVDVVRSSADSGFKLLYNDYDEHTYFHGEGMPIEAASSQPVHFLGLIFVPEDEASDVIERFAAIPGVACTRALAQRPGFNDILITHEHATKEHAVAELLKLIGVEQITTTGIGDGHNDLHLFHAVHHKVAMGNAVQSLKDAADLVIDSVENDGFARYLEEAVRISLSNKSISG